MLLRIVGLHFPFPSGGGGWGRRYVKFQFHMLKQLVLNPYLLPYPPVALFDFSNADDAADAKRVHMGDYDGWRLSDDGVIGGYSNCKATLVVPEKINMSNENTNSTNMSSTTTDDNNDKSNSTIDSETTSLRIKPQDSGVQSASEGQSTSTEAIDNKTNESSSVTVTKPPVLESNDKNHTLVSMKDNSFGIPYLHWAGEIDTTVGLEGSHGRSGFATLRSPKFPFGGAALKTEYEALEITCRILDNRVYTVNIEVNSFIPNDMFRGYIVGSSSSSNERMESSAPILLSSSSSSSSTTRTPQLSESSKKQSSSSSLDDLSTKRPATDPTEDDDTEHYQHENPFSSKSSSSSPFSISSMYKDMDTPLSHSVADEKLQKEQHYPWDRRPSDTRRVANSSTTQQQDSSSPSQELNLDDPDVWTATSRRAGFDVLYLPFSEFLSGARDLGGPGRAITIESIGFTLMDGQNGPFSMDIARVRAVNFYQGQVWEGRTHVQPKEEEDDDDEEEEESNAPRRTRRSKV